LGQAIVPVLGIMTNVDRKVASRGATRVTVDQEDSLH